MSGQECDRRLKRGSKIVLASHNRDKLVEFSLLLTGRRIDVCPASAFDLPEPEETANDFEGNALIKAEAAAKATGLPALADDSGFCVTALDGRPGIYSARWAGPERDMTLAMNRVHEEMQASGSDDKTASFVVVLCLAWPDGVHRFVRGECRGQVAWPPRGEHGHGYDPMFIPEGDSRTFAEMGYAEKCRFSHRSRAMTQFLKDCLVW